MKNVFNFTSRVDRVRGSKLRLCFLCLTLIGSGLSLQARGNGIAVEQSYEQAQQQKELLLRGLVTDKDKFPLPGVAVLVKGTPQGTTTDVNGEYSIKVKGVEKPVLVFSFVGMETQEIPYEKGKHQINVVLKESQQVMDEVVVTGIFNRPRESFTGSVKTVTSKELKLYRGQNLLSTLRNVDPSINMAMDNNLGSNPNREVDITIRGNSSLPTSLEEAENDAANRLNAPLVILDGFEVTIQKLQDFNDEEIESINILKDASATAIYGSRGANGVIVIKTKDPQAGKLKVFLQGGDKPGSS